MQTALPSRDLSPGDSLNTTEKLYRQDLTLPAQKQEGWSTRKSILGGNQL
jgi:hypothetical protein